MLRLLRRNMLPPTANVLPQRLFSAPLAAHPLPSPREAHFWYVVPDEVKDASILNHYFDLLSPCEKQSVLSMREDKLQKGALLARTLVRTTLARYTDSRMSPKSLKFRKNKFGKPEVAWQNYENWIPPPLHFNISHTSSLIACGVALNAQIGIDVEEKERRLRNNILTFARRYFSTGELQFLCAFPDPESQRREFIKLWTLKEAYVKALGRGFSAAPFRDFTIRFEEVKDMPVSGESESNASNVVVDTVDDSGNLTTSWQFGLFELDSSHYAAICMERDKNTRGGCLNSQIASETSPDLDFLASANHFRSSGGEGNSIRLKVWKTLPFVEDECVSETAAVHHISGIS